MQSLTRMLDDGLPREVHHTIAHILHLRSSRATVDQALFYHYRCHQFHSPSSLFRYARCDDRVKWIQTFGRRRRSLLTRRNNVVWNLVRRRHGSMILPNLRRLLTMVLRKVLLAGHPLASQQHRKKQPHNHGCLLNNRKDLSGRCRRATFHSSPTSRRL